MCIANHKLSDKIAIITFVVFLYYGYIYLVLLNTMFVIVLAFVDNVIAIAVAMDT